MVSSCSRHHYWARLRAWVTGRQYFHACDMTWTSAVLSTPLRSSDDWTYFPIVPHGGDITILPDPYFGASDE